MQRLESKTAPAKNPLINVWGRDGAHQYEVKDDDVRTLRQLIADREKTRLELIFLLGRIDDNLPLSIQLPSRGLSNEAPRAHYQVLSSAMIPLVCFANQAILSPDICSFQMEALRPYDAVHARITQQAQDTIEHFSGLPRVLAAIVANYYCEPTMTERLRAVSQRCDKNDFAMPLLMEKLLDPAWRIHFPLIALHSRILIYLNQYVIFQHLKVWPRFSESHTWFALSNSLNQILHNFHRQDSHETEQSINTLIQHIETALAVIDHLDKQQEEERIKSKASLVTRGLSIFRCNKTSSAEAARRLALPHHYANKKAEIRHSLSLCRNWMLPSNLKPDELKRSSGSLKTTVTIQHT